MRPYFSDRAAGGLALAERLRDYAERDDVIVLALPRGGVPVGCVVAEALGVALDVFVVRKLGVPGHQELAMGAIASGGIRIVNREVIRNFGISETIVDAVAMREQRELERRARAYRDGRPPAEVARRTVLLVDDGLATGSTMRAAVAALRQRRPARIVVAVPAAPADVCAQLRRVADEVICAITPEPFDAVGRWYEDFRQTCDDEVCALLARAAGGDQRGRPAALTGT